MYLIGGFIEHIVDAFTFFRCPQFRVFRKESLFGFVGKKLHRKFDVTPEKQKQRKQNQSQPTKHKNIFWYAKYLTYLLLLSAIVSVSISFHFISVTLAPKKIASFVQRTPNQFSEHILLIRIITYVVIQFPICKWHRFRVSCCRHTSCLTSNLGFNVCDHSSLNVKTFGDKWILGYQINLWLVL